MHNSNCSCVHLNHNLSVTKKQETEESQFANTIKGIWVIHECGGKVFYKKILKRDESGGKDISFFLQINMHSNNKIYS